MASCTPLCANQVTSAILDPQCKTIKIKSQFSADWEVQRKLADVLALNDALAHDCLITDDISALVKNDMSDVDIQFYLNTVFSSLGNNVWETKCLTAFLDSHLDTPADPNIAHIQIKIMTKQIMHLNAQSECFKQSLREMEEKTSRLESMVETLTVQLISANCVQTGDTALSQRNNNIADGLICNNLIDDVSNKERHRYSSRLNSDTRLSTLTTYSISSFGSDSSHSSYGDSSSSDDDVDHRSEKQLEKKKKKTKLISGDGFTSAASIALLLKESIQAIVPTTCHAADALVAALQPHNNQVEYRNSVSGFIKKQIRLAINASGFEAGLYDLHCNLPDDPIKITAIIARTMVSDWQKSLCDALTLDSTQKTSAAESDQEHYLYYELLDPDYLPLTDHKVSSAIVASEHMTYSVHCTIDHRVAVEVSANGRSDLCMLAFLEEVAEMVGRDNLFKRSLLLIRAWWVYETASYVGCPIKHYLSDFSLCIMVCAVFNQYYAQIHTPLQALCMFLTEYSTYDGSTHAITLQGIVPFASDNSNQLRTNDSTAASAQHALVSAQLIERFQSVFIVTPAPACGSKSSGAHNVGEAEQKAYRSSVLSRNSAQFARFGFNIVHPFTVTNMVTERISSRRVRCIQKALHSGVRQLNEMLIKMNQDTSISDAMTWMSSMFPITTQKYLQSDTRPDTLQDSVTSFERSNLAVSSAKLWQSILYCNLVTESVLVESALLTLAGEILAEKGALPVGEVGKTLSEMTGIPNLSQKLKDKFGGLKKFLERFQDLFVFSNDHPFNPHVLLRRYLSPDQLYRISAGVFPPELLVKSKKRGVPASTFSAVVPAATTLTGPPTVTDTGGLPVDGARSLYSSQSPQNSQVVPVLPSLWTLQQSALQTSRISHQSTPRSLGSGGVTVDRAPMTTMGKAACGFEMFGHGSLHNPSVHNDNFDLSSVDSSLSLPGRLHQLSTIPHAPQDPHVPRSERHHNQQHHHHQAQFQQHQTLFGELYGPTHEDVGRLRGGAYGEHHTQGQHAPSRRGGTVHHGGHQQHTQSHPVHLYAHQQQHQHFRHNEGHPTSFQQQQEQQLRSSGLRTSWNAVTPHAMQQHTNSAGNSQWDESQRHSYHNYKTQF